MKKGKLLVYGDKDLWRAKWVSDEKIEFGAAAHGCTSLANLLTCRFILVNCSTGPSALTWVDTDCAGSGAIARQRVVPLSVSLSLLSPGQPLERECLRDSLTHLLISYLPDSFYLLPLDAEDLGSLQKMQ